jgi:hypothetical protein
MQTFTPALAVAAAAIVVGSSTASAQTATLLECGPAIGVTIGAAKNSDVNGAYGAAPRYRSGAVPDVSATAEVPLADRWSARGEVGSAAWIFQKRDPWGVPLLRDRVRLTRFTATAVKQGPVPCGAPVRVYGGFGLGAYRFDFRDQRAAVTRGGAHVMIGFEIRARERVALAGDAALHAMRGPNRDPVASYSLAVFQWNVGVRYLF